MKPGDIVFKVNEKLNAFSRKKLEMLDSAGNTWYRYDKEVWEVNIVEHQILAVLTTKIDYLEGMDEQKIAAVKSIVAEEISHRDFDVVTLNITTGNIEVNYPAYFKETLEEAEDARDEILSRNHSN